jgi:putative FmdB family regulatory protein
MPTYEYECVNGHRFEIVQRMSEEPLTVCPKCKAKTRRIIQGGIGVIFKGSGFYSTDNKKSSALTSGNGSSSKGKSEDKPKEKPADKPKESSSEKTPA